MSKRIFMNIIIENKLNKNQKNFFQDILFLNNYQQNKDICQIQYESCQIFNPSLIKGLISLS